MPLSHETQRQVEIGQMIRAADAMRNTHPIGAAILEKAIESTNSLYTYTVLCFGAEIGFGEGETFEYAKQEAEEQAEEDGAMYPREDWGYIAQHPNGMQVLYNV